VASAEQAHRWTGQLTRVLMRGETVVHAEKGRRGAKRLLEPGGRGEERGGLAVGVPHGAGAAWGLAPTGGRLPDRGPAVTRAGANARAPAVGGRGSEKRFARRAWAGPRRKRVGRAHMNSMVLDLFKLILTSSN
jgi:hypothetical protein